MASDNLQLACHIDAAVFSVVLWSVTQYKTLFTKPVDRSEHLRDAAHYLKEIKMAIYSRSVKICQRHQCKNGCSIWPSPLVTFFLEKLSLSSHVIAP